MAAGKFISYLRVSTDKQGSNGLGIAAQRASVATYLNGGDWSLIKEYVEVESGKQADRPQLLAALNHARVIGATLVIAKLDRLSRNVAFIANLMDAGVEFVAADMPMANRLTVHILAAVAENERQMISQRTKAALQAAKARGVVLGNRTHGAHLRGLGNASAVAAVKAASAKRDATLLPLIHDMQANGTTTLQGIADALNEQGIQTQRGGRWHPTTVKNLLDRHRQRIAG